MLTQIDCNFDPQYVVTNASKIRILAENNGVVLLKNCFAANDLNRLKLDAIRWRTTGKLRPANYSSFAERNFAMTVRHETDSWPEPNGDIEYQMNRTPTYHNYIRFSDVDAVRSEVPSIIAIATDLEAISNAINESTYKVKWPSNREDDLKFNFELLHYPRGGGHIAIHKHSPVHDRSRFSLILGLSTPGVDFETGGVVFQINDLLLDTAMHHAAGDILLFRSELVHFVSPCDPHVRMDDTTLAGRWTAILPIYRGSPNY